MSTIDDIPDHYLPCRAWQHAWDAYDVKVKKNSSTGRREMHEELKCLRCPTHKINYLSLEGETLRHPSMVYPNDYLLKEHGRLTLEERWAIKARNANRNRQKRTR